MASVKKCQRCKKNNIPQVHHKYCQKCWEEVQFKRGNMTGRPYGYKSSRKGAIR